jgi:hypothetical protein
MATLTPPLHLAHVKLASHRPDLRCHGEDPIGGPLDSGLQDHLLINDDRLTMAQQQLKRVGEELFPSRECAQGVLKRRVASTEDAGGGGAEVLWKERNRRIHERPCSQWPSLGPFWRMRSSGPGRFRVLSHPDWVFTAGLWHLKLSLCFLVFGCSLLRPRRGFSVVTCAELLSS